MYWLFVEQLGLGFGGALVAMVANSWLTLALVLLVIRCRGLHKRCWPGWSREALTDWGDMIRLGSAGTLHMMAEWWSWEVTAAMAGLLGPVQLAAHACLINFVWLFCAFPNPPCALPSSLTQDRRAQICCRGPCPSPAPSGSATF